jgi:hypothetical protein
MIKNSPALRFRIALLNMLILVPAAWANAQDNTGGASSSSSTTTTSTSTNMAEGWYAAPWVWVVGAAVFILLLVALLNNRGRRAD